MLFLAFAEVIKVLLHTYCFLVCLVCNAFLCYSMFIIFIIGTELRGGIDILIGTPGRVLDWVNRGALDTSKLEHVVLDEVDQMLDMGFADDVEKIISHSYDTGWYGFSFRGDETLREYHNC